GERELGAPPPPQAGRRALRALARGALPRAPRPRPRPRPRHARRAAQRLDLRPPPPRPGRVRRADRGAVRRRSEEARARPALPPARDRSVPAAADARRAALAPLSRRRRGRGPLSGAARPAYNAAHAPRALPHRRSRRRPGRPARAPRADALPGRDFRL